MRQTNRPPPNEAALPEALAEVRAVYAEVERRPVDRSCTRRSECCHFRLTGRTPQLTRGEALALGRGLRASGRTRVPESRDGACPVLGADGRCLAYDHRPFGCRTHFCSAAGGPYARRDVLDLIRRLETVDERLGGDGPKPLPQALREAMGR